MKRRVLSTFLAAFCSLPVLAAPAATEPFPFPFIQTDAYHLGADEYLPGEQYVFARNIAIDGDARDDLFLFAGASRLGLSSKDAGSLILNGTARGDIWAISQRMDLNGPVEHHVRAATQLLRVNNRIGGNLYAAATTVSLDTNAIVVGSARILADYCILRGTVDGDLRITAREVRIDGVVHGSVLIKAATIAILSNARIDGTLTYESAATVMPDRQAVITEGITRQAPAGDDTFSLFQALATLLSFIGAILAGIFFYVFAPRLVVRSTLWMENYPWRTLLVGLGAFMLTPFAVLFMLASFLGIPLGLVTGALFGLGVYLGRFIAALSLARLLTGARQRQAIPQPSPRLLLLGLALFYLATFLPDFLAHAIWFWFTVTGMGGLIMAVRGAPAFPPAVSPSLAAKDSVTPPP
jgi:cytoskeletal protein CcmA (bactofilin family)